MGRVGRIFALPFVLLALLLQAAAPASAAVASARMADPFASIPICSPNKTTHDQRSPAQGHDSHQCALCSVCAAVQSLPADDSDPFTAPVGRTVDRPIVSAHAGPRGPPAITPRARAPPRPV